MSDSTRPPGADSELKRLEKRIDDLLASLLALAEREIEVEPDPERLRPADIPLLGGEKTALLNRNDQVRARVEAMISRLKSMEHGA